jgi:hypothetical protein
MFSHNIETISPFPTVTLLINTVLQIPDQDVVIDDTISVSDDRTDNKRNSHVINLSSQHSETFVNGRVSAKFVPHI